MAGRSARAGLTLVELLLALAIAVLLVAVVFSTYRTVQAVAAGQQQRVETQQLPADAADLLQDDLMRLFDAGRPETRVTLTQHLDHASLSFCMMEPTVMESGQLWSRATKVEWSVIEQQGRLALGRTARPVTGPGALGPAATHILVADLSRFDVAFHDGADWSSTWPPAASNVIPRAARIELLARPARTDQVWRLEVWIPAGSTFTSRLQRAAAPAQ